MNNEYVLRFLEMMKNDVVDKIKFHYQAGRFSFPNRTALKSKIAQLMHKESKQIGSLSYIFCTDDYLLDINRSFLQHDYYTDIITFDLSDNDQAVIGEIYISIDRVRENASTLKEKFNTELTRVLFHGALHLCGYKDKSKKDELIMRQKEDEYLKS